MKLTCFVLIDFIGIVFSSIMKMYYKCRKKDLSWRNNATIKFMDRPRR